MNPLIKGNSMNTKKLALFFVPLIITLLTGCMTVADHREGLRDSSDQKITLGVAQREIREGMSQADVAKALGSPNMVTKDRDGIETWIYDKVSTETAYSTSKNGIAGLVLGTGAIVGAGGGSSSQASGASSRTQRTLTIIIKFKKSVVSEFTYNSTSF
jgi:outer membrane protein assembly factor BamE (lipoprotein component of BamABCDE complex)